MPSLETPVLTVDANTIHRIDTRNVENLFSIWTLFSRCSGSIEEGRRLENLSWRLWNRETFCCAPGEANATTPAISISQRSSEGRYTADIPDLSGSIDSIDEEAIESDNEESASTSAPLAITRPRVRRQDSGCNRSRGKERHITPDDLEKMVITIKEKKDLEPLTMSTHSYLAPLANKITSPQITSPQITSPKLSNTATPIISAPEPEKAPSPAPSSPQKSIESTSTDAASAASAASERSATSVVRGFSPSQISSSYRSIPLISTPASVPKSALASNTRLTAPKKHAMFALGGSSQSDNDSFQESSLESRMQQSKKNKARSNMFQLGGSSAEDENSLRDSMQRNSHRSSLSDALRRPEQKKQTSFKEEVATRTIEEMSDDVFETDDDDIDESAIDDDESSDWEDSMEESGKSSIDDKLSFPRVESRRNLTSRRSLITTMLHQNDRAAALQSAASKSTSALHRSRTSTPQGPSDAPSPESDDSAPLTMKSRMRPGQEVPRTGAQPIIMTTTNVTPHQAALSPKTTRRQMLATELTASLRRHLLWERKQKNQTASAVLKRRHTAHDVANLKQYPDKVHLGTEDKGDHGSWNQYFGQGLGEYHSKGW
ncbi:hypothetical protein VF21_04561 [Pseudogymnoascus sp. 05NY08]|nr:hypothetical protein VF21_04561 [Pseudogymnoascus sp. 05NY08]